MQSFIGILMIVCTLLTAGIDDPVLLKDPNIKPQDKVLKGSISASKELPKGFYGTWSVTGIRTKTNNPVLFNAKSYDLWVLQKNRDVITLTNPSSGATSSITVDEVKGNTATFTREKKEKNRREFERPTITIDGDNFYGTDTLVLEIYKNGKLIRSNVVEYEVRGTKISGPTLKDIFADQ